MYDDTETRVFFNTDTTDAERKYYNQFATNFVGLQKARTFPNGSKCFRILAEHPEEEFIEFDPDIKTGYRTLAEWQTGESVQEMAKTILDGTMANLKFKKPNIKTMLSNIINTLGRSNIRVKFIPVLSRNMESILIMPIILLKQEKLPWTI